MPCRQKGMGSRVVTITNSYWRIRLPRLADTSMTISKLVKQTYAYMMPATHFLPHMLRSPHRRDQCACYQDWLHICIQNNTNMSPNKRSTSIQLVIQWMQMIYKPNKLCHCKHEQRSSDASINVLFCPINTYLTQLNQASVLIDCSYQDESFINLSRWTHVSLFSILATTCVYHFLVPYYF